MTLTAVPGIRVGHAEVEGRGSGCTVILGPFRGVVEVLGMATGSRELDVLSPRHLVERVQAILLTGGSAFGLAAAQGVMEWLEERGEGFDAGVARVPLVPAAVLFDLAPGVGRPGPGEGYRACQAASAAPVREGRVGAGAGATVGKALGPRMASGGGLGSASRAWGGGVVGALAVVNALGDVVDRDGTVLAGARAPDGGFAGTEAQLTAGGAKGTFGAVVAGDGRAGIHQPRAGQSTTLVALATDLPLTRTDLGRVVGMAAGAFARAIAPAGTPFDGDVLFGLCTGAEEGVLAPGELLALGVVAREVVEEAIRRGVLQHERADH